MMLHCWQTLAQRDGTELYYIIAVIILTAASALFEKLKRRSEGKSKPKPPPGGSRPVMRPPVHTPDTTQIPPARSPGPARPPRRPEPARPPASRPATPEPPVVWEIPGPRGPKPARPASPVRGPARPVSKAPRPPQAPEAQRPLAPERRFQTPEWSVPMADVERVRQEPKPESSLAEVARRRKAAAQKGVSGLAGAEDLTSAVETARRRRRLLLRTMSTTELRRAVLLREILGQPVALREGDNLWDRP